MDTLLAIPLTLVVFVVLCSLIFGRYDIIDFETMKWKPMNTKERGKGLLLFVALLLFALISLFIEIKLIRPYFSMIPGVDWF